MIVNGLLLLSILAAAAMLGQLDAQQAPTVTATTQTNIRQLFVIFRNGLSTPEQSYPNDPYITFWNKYGGLGQVEPAGLSQSYVFGQYLKNYYANFLKPIYDPSRVYIESVDFDPSIMSANVLMSGMYPPASIDQLWSPSVSWFPIPVHTSNLNDIFINTCPKYEYLKEQQYNITNYAVLENTYGDFIRNVSNFSGIDQLDYLGLRVVAENSIAQQISNLTLPRWASTNFNVLTDANDFYYQFNYGQLEMAKLVSGGIMRDIVSNIRKKMEGGITEIHLYSVRSSHLSSLMTLLDIANGTLKWPSYSAAIIIELRQDANGQYFVQVNMKNNSFYDKISFTNATIHECGDVLCPLDKFLNLASFKLSTDLTSDCQIVPPTNPPEQQVTTVTQHPVSSTMTSTPFMIFNMTTNKYGPAMCDSSIFSRLEIALIIAASILAASTIILLIIVIVIVHKYKILKTVF